MNSLGDTCMVWTAQAKETASSLSQYGKTKKEERKSSKAISTPTNSSMAPSRGLRMAKLIDTLGKLRMILKIPISGKYNLTGKEK